MDNSSHITKSLAAIMNIRYDFARAGSSTGEIKIEAIRRIFKIVAPVVSRIGGKLTRIMEEGISAVFENSTEDALHAADEIFLAASASLSAEDISRLSIGIHYGEVYMGSVKYRDFVAPIVISEGVYTAWHLCDAASRYDARVLISDKAVERVRSFENRFSSRKLGKVYLPSRKTELMLYDLFDSDQTDHKYSKKRGKLVFETGVDLFIEGKYLQSRNYFIELLRFDRNDKAAKKYIFMCDKAISGQQLSAGDKYLEIW